ncbi:MAG: hypothetical protein KIS65_06305, partial [Nitrosomonas sp.]|nr:hypothetical protein [Nitrosomonas sp.]
MKPANLSTQSENSALYWAVYLTFILVLVAAAPVQSAGGSDNSLQHVEISGISLNTPLDQIAGILTA